MLIGELLIVDCSMFNVQCSMLNAQCSMLNAQCSMLNAQCSMFNVQCSMFNVQCFPPPVISTAVLPLFVRPNGDTGLNWCDDRR